MTYEEMMEALSAFAVVKRFLRRFAVWTVFTAFMYSIVYCLITFGVQDNAAAYPKQDIMSQILCVIISILVVIIHMIASNRIWYNDFEW